MNGGMWNKAIFFSAGWIPFIHLLIKDVPGKSEAADFLTILNMQRIQLPGTVNSKIIVPTISTVWIVPLFS